MKYDNFIYTIKLKIVVLIRQKKSRKNYFVLKLWE